MTNYEFDLDEAKEVWREEAREEGMEIGMEKGIRSLMENMKLSLDQAMNALSIPVEEQARYAARIRQQSVGFFLTFVNCSLLFTVIF